MRTYHFHVYEPWKARSREEPPSEEQMVALAEGEILMLRWGNLEEYDFALQNGQDDAIELVPLGSSPAPVNPDGSINLTGEVPPTTLRIGESLSVATPTMDAGTMWKITLTEITQ